MAKKGIDVSTHQGKIDWDAVQQSGVEFAILRAGYGWYAGQKDRRFAENYAACERLSIPCGAYWYSYAETPEEARKEAELCCQTLAGKRFAYPIFYDMEEAVLWKKQPDEIAAMAHAFCRYLEERGWFVGIYSYKSLLESRFPEEVLRRYAVWLAHVGMGDSDYPYPYGMRQYSFCGSVAGIAGNVDLDWGYRDYPAIIAKAKRNGFAQAQTCPYPTPKQVLRYGAKGHEVRWLQWHLIAAGYDCGESGIDGSFGPATRAALLDYQKANGLQVDGICGPESRSHLLRHDQA